MKRDGLKAGAVSKARSLRRTATHEERILWQTLRRHMAGAKFRRQVPMGPYFVDFVSHSAKLVIELDGSHHAFQSPYDEQRTRFLENEGYLVIRFWNRDVVENLDGVFAAIEAELNKFPSPPMGEGAAKRRMRGQTLPSPSRDPTFPSPLVGEGAAKRRMRGSNSKQPLTPCPLPQGEREILSKSSILEL